MAGNADPEVASRRRFAPGGHSVSWSMLTVVTEAVLVTSVDRVILFRVLPSIQEEFGLSNAASGLASLIALVPRGG